MTSTDRPVENTAESVVTRVAKAVNLDEKRVRNTLRLLDEENTVPFITRYRKEQTGGLDEVQIRSIESAVRKIRELDERRETILRAIEEQGKLTPDLKQQIEAAEEMKRLEELYAPFKSKKRTRADEARNLGLGPLADAIWAGKLPADKIKAVASTIVGKHEKLATLESVLQGVSDIIAGVISERTDVRDRVRNTAWKTGEITSSLTGKPKNDEAFHDYKDFREAVSKLPPHRILALDRGEKKNALKVNIKWDHDLEEIRVAGLLQLRDHPCSEFIKLCMVDALKRLVNPSIEREVRRELSAQAQEHATEVFCENVRNLLLQPPLPNKRVLAIDPGYRTGCKVAALDENGTLLGDELLYVTKKEEWDAQCDKLVELVKNYQANVIAIGNGTASRETETLVAEAIQKHGLECQYIVVNEAGASVYSASEAGQEEFPELDATVRGTISIGRRLLDPLSELVKIDPQHIGVGMYQHDLSEKLLKSSLDAVVESCVNHVGVDLNRASVELLKHVSGLSRSVAKNIVSHRTENGPFQSRQQLLEVSGVGDATFTQAAGFLRIANGAEPLDGTWIHPESYQQARSLLEKCESQVDVVREKELPGALKERLAGWKAGELAQELGVDAYTAELLVESLLKPGRDPRDELPGPVFRSQILQFEDLQVGMQLTGVVTNVVDFGAFVDVGLKSDGLVHISQMSDTYIASPHDVVAVGEVVAVWIEQLEEKRKRIGLTMLKPTGPPAVPEAKATEG